MHNSLRLLPLLGAFALAACDKPQVHSLNSPLNLPQPAEENTEGPFDLRGFGRILVQTRLYGEPGQRTSWITLQAQDEAHAALTASKYRADLLGFGDLKPVSDTKLPATILALDGTGLWLIGHEGNNCHVLFARDLPALQKLAESVGATAWQPAAEKAYPGWLDGFDNDGLAIWYGGGGANVDIAAEFPWMKERDFAFCSQPPKETRYVAPGVLDTTFTDWFSAMCQEYGIKYRTLIWASRPQWAWTRQPLPYVKPHPGFIPQPDMSYSKNTVHDAFEPISATDPYVWDFRRRFTESVRDDDNLMGYHALGEVPDAGVAILASVAGMPETKASWHKYLQEVLGFDLAKVSLLHTGKADTYKSWDDVTVPIPEDFMGFNDKTVELAGQWEGLPDREKVGITQSWFAPGTMPAEGWQSVRSNDPMLLMYGGGSSPKVREKVADYWLRKNFTVSADQLADLKYLHVQRSLWHGPAYSTFVDAFLNGQPLKAVTRDDTGELTATFDVQGLLKDGENQIVLCMHGSPPAGFINLSSLPLRKYPTMTNPENRLWFDAVNFSAWLRLQAAEGILKATRAADPNRPLKIMATINLLDMTEALCAKYGAYQHDTGGAGGYWAPMTGARLARSRGMPWSCEQGGPPKDVAAMQAAMTFYLMYGNDAADLVFATTHYKDLPDVAAWVDNNLALMHCIGKMDLPPQDIAILRSSRTTRLGFSEPWNWDIARGALQGIGRNFVYVEVPDFYSGLAEKYPIIVDDGTVLLTEDDVAGIKKYVEAGGTFVAQHHTGRHLPEQADAWPLAKAFGLKVEPRLINDENYHQWPMAKITFTDDQSLVPSLRGQTCEGSGVAIDYLDRTHTGAVSLSGEGDSIQPIARWDDGTMAIAEVKAGKGRMVYLGSPFYTRMKDSQGLWVNNERQQALLDEMLVSLGAQRQSWSGNPDIWAEHWRSKNGIYDLYPVARMTKKGDETVTATVSIRRDTPISEVVEISANGHPRLPVTWADDRFTLPEQTFTPMQIRIFAAPRPDPELAVLHWFEVQRQLWRGLQPLPASDYPQVIEQEESILPLAQDWLMTTGQSGTDWTQPGFDAASWKSVKLGTFKTMGLPDDSVAQFRRVIPIPDAWKGRPVKLVFNAEWSYGITNGQLWINGQPANVKQPLMAYGNSSFSIDVSEQAKQGPVTLALQIDGTKNVPDPTKPRSRPVGVTGIFYLESEEPPVTITPLAGPWLAASDVNVFTPVSIGQDASFNYLETKFTLPAQWPGKRVFLQTPGTLGWFILNDHIVETPAWMKSIDISGMVNPSGENVLRWVPSNHQAPNYKFIVKTKIPELSLAWKN